MTKDVVIGMEKLIALFIIAFGELDGVCFVYYPKLPKPFSEGLNVDGLDGDLLSLRVNNRGEVEFWFIDKEETQFFFTWKTMNQIKPWLCAVVFTHIYDMIENMEDC